MDSDSSCYLKWKALSPLSRVNYMVTVYLEPFICGIIYLDVIVVCVWETLKHHYIVLLFSTRGFR